LSADRRKIAVQPAPSLAAAVAHAKRGCQACRYSDVTSTLSTLLGRLQAACAVLDGEARSQAYTPSAEAYHAAASILFKVGDRGLGWLALAGRGLV